MLDLINAHKMEHNEIFKYFFDFWLSVLLSLLRNSLCTTCVGVELL